jgi:UDP-glucose 4-epimerase
MKEIMFQTDKYIESINGPKRNGDMEYTFANCSKAEELFFWRPTHTLSNIVHDEIQWYKTHHKIKQ